MKDNSIFKVAMRFWETPVLIPNTMVKTETADITILVTVWEGRWLPIYKDPSTSNTMVKTRTGSIILSANGMGRGG